MSLYKTKRKCPNCGSRISYSSKYHFNGAEQNHSQCRRCRSAQRVVSDKTKRKISESESGKFVSIETRQKIKKHHADVSGKRNPMYNRRHSPSALQKMREHRLGEVTPNFNPIACQKIDEYGKKHGYHFQHALNGGERRIIGYCVDGYDEKKNVVIEYYEFWHKRIKERDSRRKRRIIDHLGCKFIELKEWESQ